MGTFNQHRVEKPRLGVSKVQKLLQGRMKLSLNLTLNTYLKGLD